jgi:uncharacterized protein UPF0547
LFLGWIGVVIVLFKAPFKAAKVMRQSAQEAGLPTDLAGMSKASATAMKRMVGDVEGGKKCPACAEMVQGEAKVCRYCGHQFETVEARPELAGS